MKRIGQTPVEWVLLAVVAVVCAVLSYLQYRWTGELSRAEPALLRAGLNEQLRRLTLAFGTDLRESCTKLLPDARDVRELGPIEAHRIQYARWVPSHDRSLFARVAIAAPMQGKLELYGTDDQGRIGVMRWPGSWEPLRAAMTARVAGLGRPPNARVDSDVIELPLFSDVTPGSELEWMIFDVDEDYVRTKVMPRLVAEYLNPSGETVYDVSVSWSIPGGAVVFRHETTTQALLKGPMPLRVFSQRIWASQSVADADGLARIGG